MKLLTLCHIISQLALSSAMVDTGVLRGDKSVPGHFHWIHHTVSSTVLFCKNCCSKTFQHSCIRKPFATDPTAVCCIENARPFWDFHKDLIVHLDLKFTYREHTYLTDIHPSPEKVNVFKNYNGNLTIFPDNLCNFSRLVEIDLRRNKIEKLINLKCIRFLDTLDLEYNKIKVVRSSSFSGMTFLRYIDLSHNLITYIDLGAFKYHPRSLARIDLEGNCLTSVDISNLYLGFFFRQISFAENQISEITNWAGLKQDDIIGGGLINITGNKLTRISSISVLEFKDLITALTVAVNYKWFLDDNPWSCDCDTYQYVVLASHASINFDGLQFACATPPGLKGYYSNDFRKNPFLLNYLICNISSEDRCPTKCHCYKQPSAKRVVVNCSSTDRSMMSKLVPEFDDLDIDFSYNFIGVFEHQNYLERTIRIDLSYNRIRFVDPAVYSIERLNFANLMQNLITSLDRSIQLKNPCNVWFGNVTLTRCNCEMRWITVWLQRQTNQKCNTENVITCHKNEKNTDLILLSETDLCPIMPSYVVYYWFGVAAPFIMLISGILYYNFRYEVKLLLRKVKLYLHCYRHSNNMYEYDIYVSFNMNNSDVLKWTVRNLRSFFENQGYTLCLPPSDFNGGAIQIEEIYTKLSKSKSFVVVLSKDYERSQFQKIEWNLIWNRFMTDSMTTITVVNHDFLQSKEIIDRKLKSFLRLGYSLNKNLMNDIQANIGPTIHQEAAVFCMKNYE